MAVAYSCDDFINFWRLWACPSSQKHTCWDMFRNARQKPLFIQKPCLEYPTHTDKLESL